MVNEKRREKRGGRENVTIHVKLIFFILLPYFEFEFKILKGVTTLRICFGLSYVDLMPQPTGFHHRE